MPFWKGKNKGSTFFNEGAAFPHGRVNGLTNSIVSLGLTRQGVSDEPTEKPIELVFLILSPAENPDEQIKILALASQAAQNRHLLQSLRSARTSEEAMRTIRDWEDPMILTSQKSPEALDQNKRKTLQRRWATLGFLIEPCLRVLRRLAASIP